MRIVKKKRKIFGLIRKASNVFITSHKNLDLDALSSELCFNDIAKTLGKKSYLVINDETNELAVDKILKKKKTNLKIINSAKVKNLKDKKSLLIIVDTNKKQLLQDETLVDIFDNILLIDHHIIDDETIKKGVVVIDTEVSSTCEMLTDLITYSNYNPSEEMLTLILAGIILDTSNFTFKTTTKTYSAAAFLTYFGASVVDAHYLLKQNISDYMKRQKLINTVKIVNNVAIAIGNKTTIYNREQLAKVAEVILQFDNVEASFVIGQLSKDKVGISSRSMGKIDVSEVLNSFNGGGTKYVAAASIEDISLEDVKEQLLLKIEKNDLGGE